MQLLRSARWLLLALLIFGAAAQQQATAQLPVGTVRTGTFIWNGERWVPAELAPAPVPAPDSDVVSVSVAPPAMPVYEQPPCPEPGLMWTPGYWHYGPDGYFWVPGAWVPAPYSGALWTPGYWGWSNDRFFFHEGYWGPHIGYYGGVNYGFGYGGLGFAGGEWRGGVFAYNTAVIHVDIRDSRFANATFVDRERVDRGFVARDSRVAFSGGPGGIRHDPAPDERIAERDQHVNKTKFQEQHVAAAKADKTSYAKANGGHPKNLAVAKPLAEEKHPAPAGMKTEVKPEGKPAPKTEAKPAPKPEAKPAPMTEAKPAPKPEAKPAPKPEAKPAPKPEAKPAPKPEAKPAPKPEAKPAPKTEAKPVPKTEAKPVPKTEAKPAPKTEAKPKPASKPEPKPKE